MEEVNNKTCETLASSFMIKEKLLTKTGMPKFSHIFVRLPFTFIAFIAGIFPPSGWSTSEDAHSACLDAQDYQGCVLAQRCMKAKDIFGCIKSIKTKKEDSNKAPKSQENLDFLGKRKIKGMTPYEDRSGRQIFYIDHQFIAKLKVRSVYGRYLHFPYTRRYEVPAKPEVPGYWSQIKAAETICNWNQSSYKCTTKPATGYWVSKKETVPAYITTEGSDAVIDCKDKTAKWSKGNRRWRSATSGFIAYVMDDYCSRVKSLPSAPLTKYATGEPTPHDLRFIQEMN